MRLSFGSLVPVLALLGILAPGCEEELPSTDVQTFTDQANRSCSVDAYDSQKLADCDVDPATLVTCTAGTVAIFNVGATLMGDLENCAGCLDEAARSTIIDGMTCAFVTCNTDADCVEDRYTCVSGTCQS